MSVLVIDVLRVPFGGRVCRCLSCHGRPVSITATFPLENGGLLAPARHRNDHEIGVGIQNKDVCRGLTRSRWPARGRRFDTITRQALQRSARCRNVSSPGPHECGCEGVAGQRDCCGRSYRLQPKSNNNEAIVGVALFCAGLTLETYVTGAQNPVKCSASCGRGNLWQAKPP
jgi:hypothetical protein